MDGNLDIMWEKKGCSVQRLLNGNYRGINKHGVPAVFPTLDAANEYAKPHAIKTEVTPCQ